VELVSGTRRLSSKREKRLQDPANGHIKDARTALSKNSIHRAQTIDEIEAAQEVRRSVRDMLRQFENSSAAQKGRHHNDLQTARTWAVLAADERQHVKDHIRGT
jgi:hypothetical protein